MTLPWGPRQTQSFGLLDHRRTLRSGRSSPEPWPPGGLPDPRGRWIQPVRHRLPPRPRLRAPLEELMPALGLGVTRVLDLCPGRLRAVGPVGASCPLCHDALSVACAGSRVEVLPASAHVIEVPEARLEARDQPAERPLAREERLPAQVLAVEREEIEGVEVWPLATEQERVEVAGAVRPKADDLAVEDGSFGPGPCARDPRRGAATALNTWPRRETRVQRWPSMMARARKPSCFNSKSQPGWSKGSRTRMSGMGRQGGSTRPVYGAENGRRHGYSLPVE